MAALESSAWIRLTVVQIEAFKLDGILVVQNVLRPDEVASTRDGLHSFLLSAGVDVNDLENANTGEMLKKLSSTNGSGGVIDVFYEPFKLSLAEHPVIFAVMAQLWEATFGSNDPLYSHGHGRFESNHGYTYIDRVGFRVPSRISRMHGKESIKGKRKPLQRSLTPHLDCCPASFHGGIQGGKKVQKWRPIQCFIALTDTQDPNMGGFEAAKGFHHKFEAWAEARSPQPGGQPAPCMGEFTPIRPKEDSEIISQFSHVPCSAGDLVLWDNRIPHSNSRENNSVVAREVVYLGFLPEIPLNRAYAETQLERLARGLPPNDQWQETKGVSNQNGMFAADAPEENTKSELPSEAPVYNFSLLGRRLLGMEPWE
jgi:hypothetical protein